MKLSSGLWNLWQRFLHSFWFLTLVAVFGTRIDRLWLIVFVNGLVG